MNNTIDKEKFSIRKVNNTDISTIELWLNKEYIKKWYVEPQVWLEEIKNVDDKYSWINHYIVENKNNINGILSIF